MPKLILRAGALLTALLSVAPSLSAQPKDVVASVPAPAPKPAAPALDPVVVPSVSAEERKYFADMDRLIAPVRDLAPSADDMKRLEAAMQALGARDPAKASAIAGEMTDALLRKLVLWQRMRSGQGEVAEMRSFLAQNPGWPDGDTILARIEEKLLAAPPKLADLKLQIGGEPKTAAGTAALARAHLAAGNQNDARTLTRKAWLDPNLSASEEAIVQENLGNLLTPADHKARFDLLLIDDQRWTRDRNDRAATAKRLLPLLAEAERKKAEARLAVFLRKKSSKGSLEKLPKGEETDWGLVFQQVQDARRSERYEDAWKLLLSVPAASDKIGNADGWWSQRRATAYAALNGGHPKIAYDLVKEAGPLSVNPRKEQAFMAGFIAFRFLNDARSADRHFADMRKAADGPLSKAKSEYWSGRVAEALGDAGRARDHYTAASRFLDTFHGQLALLQLGADKRPFTIRLPAMPSPEQAKAFNEHEVVRAGVVLHKAGLLGPARTMFFHLARTDLQAEANAAMLAHLAEALSDTQAALRIGKAGIGRGANLLVYAYPVHRMPSYAPLRNPPEPAFLLGIARQESEFNRTIVSSAGARGLLQVMPVTAHHVCRDYKVKCELPRLLTDNAYNARIASAYIADRMDEFHGSYVLTLAGYNAGPGRARQWIRQFGDPRDPKVDPIDWIERIPFEETREYVAKVLSNVQVYRSRLGEQAAGLRLGADLVRARGRTEAKASSGAGESAKPAANTASTAP